MNTDGGKVLVVEDDELVSKLLDEMLSQRGHRVASVADGGLAQDAAHAHAPDVILLDIGLPGVHGLTVLERLKADPALSDIPVIMITAWSEASLLTKSFDAGAHDYVTKPFDLAELSARVDAAVRLRLHRRRRAGGDPLTGLPERSELHSEIERRIEAAARTERPLTVALLDVDRLERINESGGHARGDAVLRELAHRLGDRLRPGDVLGRWGADEFLLIAPGTEFPIAARLAEDLRFAIENTPIAGFDVTASVGFATWSGETAERLTDRAEAALHRAKEDGRNTVRGDAPVPRLRVVA